MEGAGAEALPDERLVRQWARHVEKVRQQVREAAGHAAGEPVLRIVLQAQDVSRFLTVSDGDGFVAAGLRFRLLGMDAPEIEQNCTNAEGKSWPCGKRARWRLFELLSGRRLEILVQGVDCYGRLLCVCLADGEDVAEIMVREGLAICYRSRHYAQAERKARQQRRGMWSGSFEEPAAWRRANRDASGNPAAEAAPARGWSENGAGKRASRTRHARPVSGPWDRQRRQRVEERKVVPLHGKRRMTAPRRMPRGNIRSERRDVVRMDRQASSNGWRRLRKALNSLLSRIRG